MILNQLYDGYLALAEKGYCPIFVPTRDGLFAAVIAPRSHQVDLIQEKQTAWLLESVSAVRDLAVESGFQLKG